MNAIWDRIRDWVLLIGLLTFSLTLLMQKNEPMFRAFRSVSISFSASVEGYFSNINDFFRASEENDDLRNANITLSSQLARLREAQIENTRLRQLLGFRATQQYRLLSARIVRKDITRQENLLTIDVGEIEGIKIGMPFIDDRGILGKVIFAGRHHAVVQPYLNTKFRAPAKIQGTQASGIVRWEGSETDEILLQHIVKTENPQIGSLIVTNGFSDVFPAGFPIGHISRVEERRGRNDLLVYLTPTALIDNAEHGFIIIRQTDPERNALEQEVNDL